MERGNKNIPISKQLQKKVAKPHEDDLPKGNFSTMISTGSTLLDLAISGGKVRGGGIPGGILVEAFGPSGSGKTALLCEIAGDVQRKGGDACYDDPEARIDEQFARMFGMSIKEKNYTRSATVSQIFEKVLDWKPETKKKGDVVHGIFTDSLAALSTELEMEKKEGDKMVGKRAKDFSAGFRKICRYIADENYLLVCSNQIRQNMDAGPYGQKYTTPGGEAMGFYASLRLRFSRAEKIWKKKTIQGKEVKRVVGVRTEIDVFKSSIWKPYHTAHVTILFDYGIDDIRENLQFIKDFTSNKVYTVGGENLSKSMDESIEMVEENNLEKELRDEVIDLWETIESKFDSRRKPKR